MQIDTINEYKKLLLPAITEIQDIINLENEILDEENYKEKL